jgi:hypothetical protein
MVDQVTFIEQNGKCIIRNFGRPCDEFAERVWPIKISDGARVTMFNKGLVSTGTCFIQKIDAPSSSLQKSVLKIKCQ